MNILKFYARVLALCVASAAAVLGFAYFNHLYPEAFAYLLLAGLLGSFIAMTEAIRRS